MEFNTIIKIIAQKNGVREDEVLREMQAAIEAALKSEEPTAQAHWRSLPKRGDIPTPEEVVAYLVQQVIEDSRGDSL
ncbi:MAG: hypothetical protein LUE89_03710 [Clostridiales bacterium]|nr:hypothetical protein [Clostridiales bacterium]